MHGCFTHSMLHIIFGMSDTQPYVFE